MMTMKTQPTPTQASPLAKTPRTERFIQTKALLNDPYGWPTFAREIEEELASLLTRNAALVRALEGLLKRYPADYTSEGIPEVAAARAALAANKEGR